MRKGFLSFVLVLLTLGLAGCNGSEATEVIGAPHTSNETSVSVSTENEGISVNNSEEKAPLDTALLLVSREMNHVAYIDDEDIYSVDTEGMYGYACASFSRFVVYEQYENDGYTISLYDAKEHSFTEICRCDYFDYADVYKGVLYIVGYNYQEGVYVERAFDINTLSEVDGNQPLYDAIKGYRLEAARLDNIGSRACIERLYDECGYLVVSLDNGLYRFDGKELTSFYDGSEHMDVLYYDKESVIYSYKEDWSKSECDLYVYENKTGFATLITNRLGNYLGFKEGIIYFSETDASVYCLEKNTLFSFDTKDNTYKTISSFERHPGVNLDNPGVQGFTFYGDYIYCVADDGLDVSWYVLPMNEKREVEASPTAIVIKESEYRDYGHVEAVSHMAYCEECKEPLFKFYEEYFVFDEGINNYEGINGELLSIANESKESEESSAMDLGAYMTCEEHKEYYSKITLENEIYSFERISDSIVEISTSGYWYGGGAHGMPLLKHTLVDLENGRIIGFNDLFTGTEEELKEIVAEKTKEDFETNDDTFYFASTPEDVYAEAYEYISFTTVSADFTDGGIEIEYPPYAMGPYAAGFITVFISYEELGITLY